MDERGQYKTPFKDPRKRFGASLGNLSSGRVGIINMANMNLHLAVVIAIRYSAARRQFGQDPKGKEILEQLSITRFLRDLKIPPFS